MIPPWSIWWRCKAGPWSGNAAVDPEVRKAFEQGRLISKPCLICGTQVAWAHHADYSKPLAVVFLCPRHHAQLHSRLLNRFLELGFQIYTQRFHDQVLNELKRDYQEPRLPLFAPGGSRFQKSQPMEVR
jgi:hypothetical protein